MKIKSLFLFICFFVSTSLSFAQSKEARKISDLSRYNCEELKIQSFDFRDELTKEEGAKGFIIVYEGKDQTSAYDKKNHNWKNVYISPMFGQINSRIKGIRGMLNFVSVPNASLKSVKIINGGFRERFAVEFWIIPKYAQPPKPTPTLKIMKYRKGKLLKFRYLDC